MKLAVQIVEKHPFTIEAKGPDGEWFFVCAVDKRVLAEDVAEALRSDQGLELQIVENTL